VRILEKSGLAALSARPAVLVVEIFIWFISACS
jgi:hypothetical protein